MDMTIRAMKPDERNYSYTQEKSVQKNTGCIGHLRGDMGRSGEEFYTSWDDHEDSLKTETFKSEFNNIVNALRKDERYGLLLSSRKTLAACCHAMPDCAFDGSSAQEYGFRADTKAYSYMIRCNPTQGNYNFYIYAYDRAKLDKVLEMQKEQMQKCEVPMYLYPRTYAQKHGEMEEYRMSRQANIACRDAIDRAIREHYHDNVLSRKAVQNVVGQYGFDRTLYVLAVTVMDKNWDGRISQNNKNWAKMQPVYADVDELGQEKNQAFVARSHPGLVDLFLRETRRAKEANLEKNTPALAKCKREKER